MHNNLKFVEYIFIVDQLKDVDWEHVLDEEAPFVPQPDNATDTTYFNTRYFPLVMGLAGSGVALIMPRHILITENAIVSIMVWSSMEDRFGLKSID